MSDNQRPAVDPARDLATRKLSDPNATVNLSAEDVAALRDTADKATRKLDNPFATVSLSREDAAALRDAAQASDQAGVESADKATRKLDNPYATVSLSREEAAALRDAPPSPPTAPTAPALPHQAPNPSDQAAANLRGGAVASQESAAGKQTAGNTNQGWSGNDQTMFSASPAQPYTPPPSQPAAQDYNQHYAPPAPAAQNYAQPYGAAPTGSQPNAFPATPVLSSAPASANANRIAFILMGLGVLLIIVALVLAMI